PRTSILFPYTTLFRSAMQELLADLWNRFHSTIIFVTHDIPEAVYLGDDIYIMKYAPSKIVSHIPVDLPTQRNRDIKRESEYTKIDRKSTRLNSSHVKI